jgi:signal peptidase II
MAADPNQQEVSEPVQPTGGRSAMSRQISSEVLSRAWLSGRAQKIFWFTVIVILAIDLVSKWAAFEYINGEASKPETIEPIVVLPGFLEFTKVLNPGAVFGMGKGGGLLFIVATLVAVGFLLQLFAKSRPDQRAVHILLAMSLGGALGNLYDRAIFSRVRDMIHISTEIVGIPVWPWVFNVADVALVVGIGVLLLGWTFGVLELPACSSCKKTSSDCR